MAALFASPPLRNRATLGGSLATASPIGDGAPLLLALDARVHLAGQRGRRTVPLSSFFTGYRRTVLGAGRIDRRRLKFPSRCLSSCAFTKWRSGAWTTSARWPPPWRWIGTRQGKIARARFAFGGVAAVPLRRQALKRRYSASAGTRPRWSARKRRWTGRSSR